MKAARRPQSLAFVASAASMLLLGCGPQPEPRVLSAAVGAAGEVAAPESLQLRPSSVVAYRQGPQGALTAADLVPVMGKEEAYVEGWEFVVVTEDFDLKLKFQVGNLGFGDHKGHWSGFVTRRSDGRYFDIDRKLDSSRWSFARDRFEITGSAWALAGEPGALLIKGVAGDDGELSFDLQVGGPAWRPGTGLVLFGEEQRQYFKTELMSAQGRVNGTVVVDGVPQSVHGVGYAYHSGLNLAIHEMSDRIYHFRVLDDEHLIEWRTYRTTQRFDHADVGYLVVTYQGVVVFESAEVLLLPGPVFTDDERAGYAIAKGMTLVARHGDDEARLVLGAEALEVSDPLEALPPLERAVAGAVVRPLKYHQRGPWRLDLRVDGQAATLEGEHEYTTVAFR